MQYLNQGDSNTLVLNINNNARPEYTGYTLSFLHVLSQTPYQIQIDTNNPTQYTKNDRYCTIRIGTLNNFAYQGQYSLLIYGNGVDLVFSGIAYLSGQAESEPFIAYISDNEDNQNYIYIEE